MIATFLSFALMPSSMLDFAIEQWKETPEMRIEDAYKWLFHATLGGEHAITSETGPRAWLDREWSSLESPLLGEEEVVPLTQDGSLIRINLRPYKSKGGDKEMLLWAFVLSAERFSANKQEFVKTWNELGARLKHSTILRLKYEDWKALNHSTQAAGYGAIHHSREYEKRYKPAYRVVLRELWSGS